LTIENGLTRAGLDPLRGPHPNISEIMASAEGKQSTKPATHVHEDLRGNTRSLLSAITGLFFLRHGGFAFNIPGTHLQFGLECNLLQH
jgi:hypothetical protein